MKRSGPVVVAAVLASLGGMVQTAHSVRLPTERVLLATRDKSAIAIRACNRPLSKNDVLTAERILKSSQIYVEVTCEPMARVEGLPSLKIASCDNVMGRWGCVASDAVRLQLAGKEVVLSYDSRIDIKAVLEIANYAATVRLFNGRDVAAYIDGRCHVGDGRSEPYKGAVSFDFGCGGWSGAITKDCRAAKCRLFFTQFAEFIA
jgi:hypothetical protein